MASVFSYYGASVHSSSDPSDQLTHSPHAGDSFASTPDSSLTSKLTSLLIAATRTLVSAMQRTSPLHGTAANGADRSMRKPRRLP